MLDRLAARSREILSIPMNPSATLIMAIYTLTWGLWLVNPMWSVFSQAELYSALSSVMPEVYWGTIAVGCGLFMIWGVVKNSYKSLTKGAYAGFIHWLVISGGYFVGDWHNTGGITSLAIALYCGIVYLNLRVNRDNLPLEENAVNI